MAEPASPPAMIDREPRQAWKGAAAAVDSGAGVWLAGDAAISLMGLLDWAADVPLVAGR